MAGTRFFKSEFKLLYLLLAVIFGGAIVGETTALSVLVAVAGPSMISKSYIVNGILLFGLPIFFFRNVDRFRRERILWWQLLVTGLLLCLYLLSTYLHGNNAGRGFQLIAALVYPLSYLSKTVIFLTFWTLANDLCDPAEAKREFPIIAGWGLFGGLCGALAARGLLMVTDMRGAIWLWITLYLAGLAIVSQISRRFELRLRQPETAPFGFRKVSFPEMIQDVFEIRLLRVMGGIYFLVFVALFSLDFLFWKAAHERFQTSQALANFQFSFYFIHAIATAGCLWYVTPHLIRALGFARLLFSFPIVLLSAALLLVLGKLFAISPVFFFALVVVAQFFRHLVFENGFSPIYQMFFVAIPKERRGRAKTALEGVVKPAAILLSGLYLTLSGGRFALAFAVIACCSLALIGLVFLVRRRYVEELIQQGEAVDSREEMVSEIGSRDELEIISSVDGYSTSEDPDFRRFAVRILSSQATIKAFRKLMMIFERETVSDIQELVARSLKKFDCESREVADFFALLLKNPSPRIRANAVFSLAENGSLGKRPFLAAIEPMLFDNSLRIQTEAARFLWVTAGEYERNTVRAMLASLLSSTSTNRRTAGLYLVGALRPVGWEERLIESLSVTSLQVFTTSLDTLLRYASIQHQIVALRVVEGLSRRHMTVAGSVGQIIGAVLLPLYTEVLPQIEKREMFFELIRAIRIIRYETGMAKAERPSSLVVEKTVMRWIGQDLENLYRDFILWSGSRRLLNLPGMVSARGLMDDVLRDRILRIAGRVLDGVALLDRGGMTAWVGKEIDLQEHKTRVEMVEVLETMQNNRLVTLLLPLISDLSWDALALTARSLYKEMDGLATEGLDHFLNFENRLISLCALYCQFRLRGARFMVVEKSGTLNRLAEDKYEYIAYAAKSLLEIGSKDGKPQIVETFNLLENAHFLKQTSLFRSVPVETLIGLAEICEVKTCAKGTVVSREGLVSDALFVVCSGSLDIIKESGEGALSLGVVGAGETYGEIGLFSQSPRSASAIAREESRLFEIQRSALKKLLMTIPEMAISFLTMFSEKLARSGEEIAHLRSLVAHGGPGLEGDGATGRN